MNRFISQKFRFFTFVCISLLIYVHGYNLKETYLTPYSTVNEPMSITTYLEYLFANGLLRFRIPMLFIISGYIFALQDHLPWWQRVKKRFKTLIIPYFIWSAIGLLISFLWQQSSFTLEAWQHAKLDQLNDNRLYTDMSWHDLFIRWTIAPISFQLWFILAIFIFNVIYPFLRWMITRYPLVWLSLTFLMWFSLINVPLLDGRGLFYFSLGIWLQKTNFPLEKKPRWFSVGLAWIFFIGLNIIRSFMAFELPANTVVTFVVLLLLYNFSILAGIMAIWFSADEVVRWSLKQQWFMKASSYSFFIFGMHIPLLSFVMHLSIIHLSGMPGYRLFTYIFVPLLVLLFCIAVGALIRKFFPSIYRVMTGGRGLG
jgi:fucose 4-O-acetylase-like acetyltransferase